MNTDTTTEKTESEAPVTTDETPEASEPKEPRQILRKVGSAVIDADLRKAGRGVKAVFRKVPIRVVRTPKND